MLSKKPYIILIFQLFFTYHTLTAKLDGKTLTKKGTAYFFQLENFGNKQLSIPTHYSIYNVFLHISKPLGFDQMRMGWIKNNSVSRKVSNRENI